MPVHDVAGVHHGVDVAAGDDLGELLRPVVAGDADEAGEAVLLGPLQGGHRFLIQAQDRSGNLGEEVVREQRHVAGAFSQGWQLKRHDVDDRSDQVVRLRKRTAALRST